MPTNIVVCGAAGRMGKLLVSLAQDHPETRLVGAVEAPRHPAIGEDAGEVASLGRIGVTVTDDYSAVAAPNNVTVDFTVAEAALGHLRTAVTRGAAIVVVTTACSAEVRAEGVRMAATIRSLTAP